MKNFKNLKHQPTLATPGRGKSSRGRLQMRVRQSSPGSGVQSLSVGMLLGWLSVVGLVAPTNPGNQVKHASSVSAGWTSRCNTYDPSDGYVGRRNRRRGPTGWAKALAIGSGERPAILITVDNCGVPAGSERVTARLKASESGRAWRSAPHIYGALGKRVCAKYLRRTDSPGSTGARRAIHA